jgi:hypothetical protein
MNVCTVTICAWCDDVRARTAMLKANGYEVSHGMCEACVNAWQAELRARQVVRDASGRIVAPAQDRPAPRPRGPWDRNGE